MKVIMAKGSNEWPLELRERTSRFLRLKSERESLPKRTFLVDASWRVPVIINKKAVIEASDEEEALDRLFADSLFREEGCKDCEERSNCIYFIDEFEGKDGLVDWDESEKNHFEAGEVSFDISPEA